MKNPAFFKEIEKECFYCKEAIPQDEKFIILKIGEMNFFYHFYCIFEYIEFLKEYKIKNNYSKINMVLELDRSQIMEEWEIAKELGFAKDFMKDVDIMCRELIKKTLFTFILEEFFCKEKS